MMMCGGSLTIKHYKRMFMPTNENVVSENASEKCICICTINLSEYISSLIRVLPGMVKSKFNIQIEAEAVGHKLSGFIAQNT